MPDLRTWHTTTTFTVTAVNEPVWHRDGGPDFDADSPMALTALGPTVGPTPVLALRTLSIVGRTGPHQWHLSDLASMHGVANNVMRHALDRLARFDWTVDAGPGEITLHLAGNLSVGQIERLHPAIARHYLGQPAAPQPRIDGRIRFPLAPLLARAGAGNLSHLARILGVSRATVQAASSRGLSERAADHYAVAAGLHPAEVWPELWVTP
jgi:hypothetical protein